MNPRQREQSPADVEEQLKEKSEHILLYGGLRKFGISLFEPDGKANGGIEYLLVLLRYFEKIESYGRCVRIRDWIKEYRKRWPYKPVKKQPAELKLTVEQEANIKLFAHYAAVRNKLRRYRMACFDEQGRVIIVDRENGEKELKDGREFILETLAFFEAEDKSYCYRICAELKPVLDEYDKTFPKK